MIRRSKENLLIQAKRLLDEYEAVDTNYKTTSIFGLSKDEKYQEYLREIEENKYYSLQHVPEEYRTPELCKIAVEKTGFNLQFVPENLITPELCMIAVKEAGQSLQFVPEDFITPELCMIAVEDDKRSAEFIPEKNVEVWLAVCRSYPRLCNYVSEDTLDAMTDEQYEEFKSIRNRIRSCFYR